MKSCCVRILASTAILIFSSAGLALESTVLVQPSGVQTAPDNSAQNKDHGITADNQANAKADRLTTANIRKAIIADKGLSTYAHNVKIITVNGAVTLKGPVTSDEEKEKVASDAASIVSADKITNHLTVKQ
jgi:osmotically-inducible protein OsmY